MLTGIKARLKKTFVYAVWTFLLKRYLLLKWLAGGKVGTPPYIYKIRTLKRYADRYRPQCFIETGTYKGDTLYALRNRFRQIHSIEIDDALYESAVRRFLPFGHVRIHHGDSGTVLPSLIAGIGEPVLFWLDGHYSGPHVARGALDTPILSELTAILDHPVKDHVILVDDARDFTGKNDYPTIDYIVNDLLPRYPHYRISVADDIIRIVPARADDPG